MLERLDLWDLKSGRVRVKFKQDVIEKFLNYCVEYSGGKKVKLSKLINKPILSAHFLDFVSNKSYIQLEIVARLLDILPEDDRSRFKTELAQSLIEIKLSGSLSKPIRNPIFPITVSTNMIEFLGHLLGDGCIESRENCHMIWYTNKSENLLCRFSEIVINIFGDVKLYNRVQRNGVKDVRCPSIVGMVFNNLLGSSLTSLDFINRLNNEQKAVFLRALFDDEGCVTVPKYQIIIEMANKSLIENIKSMLLEFGIVSGKISEVVDNRKTSYRRRYRLCISGKENFELFREKINFINPDKSKRLETLLNSYKLK